MIATYKPRLHQLFMRRASKSLLYLLFPSLLLTLLTIACGKKPDGTPYGVDPAKLPEGRAKAASTSIYKQDVPKGAEMNAVTNGARIGQATNAAPQATQPR
jgi:hypothetical protein